MRAAIIESPGKVVVRDVPEPEPGPREVIIEVQACGICATDLHIFKGDFVARYPIIPGHEFSGVVVKTGAKVTEFKTGDRVAADPNIFCCDCYYCRTNRGNHCENFNAVGVTLPGAMAQRVAVPVRCVFPLGNLSFVEGAFIEPVSCCVYGLRRLELREGDEVLVVGSGAVGLEMAQLLKHGGAARVTIVEKRPDRLGYARKLGFSEAFVADGEIDARLRALCPRGYDVVVDASGAAPAVKWMLTHLKPTGKALVFGVCAKDARIEMSPFDIYKNDWTIIGSFALCYTYDPALRLLDNKVIDVMPLVSHTLPLSEFQSGLELLGRGEGLKFQVSPNA